MATKLSGIRLAKRLDEVGFSDIVQIRNKVMELRAEGVDPADIRRIMAPIGINIGARTPEETAVSICAEIISQRSGVRAPSLRDGTGPIHQVAS